MTDLILNIFSSIFDHAISVLKTADAREKLILAGAKWREPQVSNPLDSKHIRRTWQLVSQRWTCDNMSQR